MDCVSIAIRKNSLLSPFSTDTALFVTTEECLGNGLRPGVDEDVASFQASGNFLSLGNVFAPYTGTETCVRGVCASDNLL